MKCLDPITLIPRLCETELPVDFKERVMDRPESLFARLEKCWPNVMPHFLESLDKEDQHLGHEYISSLLTGKEYATKHDISMSSRIRKRIQSQSVMAEITQGLSLRSALITHLIAKKLLTDDESGMLQNCSAHEGNETLLKLLDTKGPTAHLLFLTCLKEEVTHRTHRELYDLICNGDDKIVLSALSVSRKRKANTSCHKVSVTKRVPDRLKLDGDLDEEEYLDTIQKLRQLHLHGEWEAAEKLVNESSKKSTEYHIAILLESCTGFITHGLHVKKVEKTVEKAKELCGKVSNNCYVYLKGRCEWTLAKLYRYSNQLSKALICIKVAQQIQYNVKAGEDTALVNYCHGCILSEYIDTANGYDPNTEKEARRSFELAIAHASSGNYGLDLSHPKIKLSKLWLRSFSHAPHGRQVHDALRKARDVLDSIDWETLAPKTQSMYFYTKSDLYKEMGNPNNAAFDFASRALRIAKENELTTEIEQARRRISELNKGRSS